MYVKNIQCGVTYYDNNLHIGYTEYKESTFSYMYFVFTFNSTHLFPERNGSFYKLCYSYPFFQSYSQIVCFIQNNKFFMYIPYCSIMTSYNSYSYSYIYILNLPDYNYNNSISTINLALTGGYEKDENNYILYGISSNKIYILNINGENISLKKLELYNNQNYFIPYSISGLRHNSNLYLLFDNKTNINIFVSNINSNSYEKFIVSTFNPKVTNITFIKGFISNNTFTILIKDKDNEIKWKITTLRTKCQNHIELLHKSNYSISLSQLSGINSEINNYTLYFQNSFYPNQPQISNDFELNFYINDNINYYSANYTFYSSSLEDMSDYNNLENPTVCQIDLQFCDISCKNNTE